MCYRNGIIHSTVDKDSPLEKVKALLGTLFSRNQDSHRRDAEWQLDDFVSPSPKHLASALILDADKTLSAVDSGQLFWGLMRQKNLVGMQQDPLKDIFSGPLGYTSVVFLQASLLYEESVASNIFEEIYTNIAL